MTARLEMQRDIVPTIVHNGKTYIIRPPLFSSGKKYEVFASYKYKPSTPHYGSFILTGLPPEQGAEVDGVYYVAGSPPINKFGIIIHFE